MERLRTEVPHLVFRTAFIVGHPGESDDEFQELCDFVQWAELERVGVFQYSDEESSPSYGLDDKVPTEVAEERCEHLMAIARDIARSKNEAYIGS